jgi:selenocysteine-specific elongation factor
VIIGTAGHIDHGKTALVRALTGVDTDRLKEEKARGISIDLGFAFLPAAGDEILGFVDVPGHERFIRNMLAGATGIDFVLLTVAADDGVMPQTIEHLAIVDLLGIERGVVALTKCDLVPPARRDEVSAEIANILAPTKLTGAEIIPVSTVTMEGIDELRGRLMGLPRDWPGRSARGRFRLAVDRCFTIQGAGTVVTGTILSGSVATADHVIISPTGIAARVRAIHAQNQPRQRGQAGERCAINLAGEGVAKDAIRRGDVVLDPALHAPADRIDARVRLLPSERSPIKQWAPVHLHHASAEITARIVPLTPQPIPPGGEAYAQLVLDRPIAAAIGDRFVLRDTTAQRTIAGGVLLDLRAPARKRRAPERLAQLDAAAVAEPGQALAALLERAPLYVDLSVFGRDRALSTAELDALARQTRAIRLPMENAILALSPANYLRLKRGLLASLEAFHAQNPDLPGIGTERLRLSGELRLPERPFSALLRDLAQKGEISLQGAWVHLPGHEVQLTSSDEHLWNRVRPLLSGAERFRPPRVRDIAGVVARPEAQIRQLLKLLGRMAKVDEIAHDHYFLREVTGEIVTIALDLGVAAPRGEFSAAQLRDRINSGRKVAIQILQFLDRHGVTLRRGDLRRMNKRRLDLFRISPDGSDKPASGSGRESSPVGRPDFKSGRGRETVLGGFDSLSLPPHLRNAQ